MSANARQRMERGALAGAVIGLFVALFFSLVGGWDASLDLFVGLPILFALIGAGWVAVSAEREPFYWRERAPLPTATIRRHAIRCYAANGWTLQGNDDDARASSREAGDAGCLFLLGRQGVTTTILTTPVSDGTELEINGSARGGGGLAAVGFLNSLHELGEEPHGTGARAERP